MHVLADTRWDDDTGIGRVYREVINRTPNGIRVTEITKRFALGSPLSPIYLTTQIRHSTADVFWSPAFMPPIKSKIPFVVTVHDLIHLYYYSKFHAYYFRWVLTPLLKKSKRVITVSDFTSSLLITQLNFSPNLITRIYNGVNVTFFKNQEVFNLGRPYVVYVGNRRSYKNIERMIAAFSRAKISKDFVFALSGDATVELERIIRYYKIENRIKFLGHIAEDRLPSVYKGAVALFYMSLMEGFGLPVVEAMASGTPVITSNNSSLAEISNGAAALCDPLNVSEMSQQLELILNNSAIKSELQASGKENAKRFDWNDTARQTWDIISQP